MCHEKMSIRVLILTVVITVAAQALFPADALAKSKDYISENSWAPFEMLGVRTFIGASTVEIRDNGETIWSFQSEQKVRGIEEDGPADGKLKSGDTIVAIDGLLITTRKAGKRFAAITPGEPVEFTVRRGRRTFDVEIIPEAPSGDRVWERDSTWNLNMKDLSVSIDALSEMAEQLSVNIKVPDLPELPDIASLVDMKLPDVQPEGWFGFGLSMSGSIRANDDGPSRWDFNDPPEIHSVEEGSPADLAGLEEGDKLTHIDGARIDSKKGGRLFSSVEPGQTVTWTVKRGRKSHDVEMTAEERPASSSNRSGRGLLSGRYYNLLPGLDGDSYELRYSGALGDAKVEVEGTNSANVEVTETPDEIVIEMRGAVVRIRRADKED